LVDNRDNAQKMEQKYAKGQFPIYYDEENEAARKLHQEIIWYRFGRMPGMLIVDKAGTIKYAYYGDSMSDIPKNQDVLEVIASWMTPETP
jgi:peroxiredoxin